MPEKHYKSPWCPLGFWRTIRFFSPWHPHRSRVAAWRHFGWELEVEIAPGALLDHGRVKIHSSRINPYAYGQDGVDLRPQEEWLADIAAIRKMLDDKGLYDVETHTTHGKPSGDYYIDNLAVEFKGDWGKVLDKVLSRNGEVRTFDTGATRDTDTDKLAYEGFFSPLVLQERARYMHKHRVQSDGALRAPDNWQKGIPLEAYIDSGWRHMMDWWLNHRGYESRESLKEALCALAFNVDGYLHEILKAEA